MTAIHQPADRPVSHRLSLSDIHDVRSMWSLVHRLEELPNDCTTIIVDVPPVNVIPAVWLRCLLYAQQVAPRQVTFVVENCTDSFRNAVRESALGMSIVLPETA